MCKSVLCMLSTIQNGYWTNFVSCQQIACLRQSVEEKYNIPPKPKRPLTPYFKYMAQIRPELKRAQPHAKVTDLVRETALRWEKIEPQVKQKLEAEYKHEHEIYAKERLQYDTQLTDDQKNALKQARIDRLESLEKRKYRKKCKDNNKPKKPCSAFVLYMKSVMPNRGSREFKQFQKDTASSWFELPDTEKKPFVDEMHRQMKEYQKLMVEWERKMIKLEHKTQELQTGQDQCRKQQDWDTGSENIDKNNDESTKRNKENLIGKLKGFFNF
ncbi:mitochondrial transcription factor A [Carabus blaptoides fortunei]